ncbi:MAG: hypothetical protein ACI35S_05730 [Anaeroplasma sp.]
MKLGKYAKIYSMSTQGILSIGVYTAIGFFIGYLIDKDSFWPPLLAVFGLLLGLGTFISYLLYLIKEEEKEKKKNESRKEN